MFLWQMNLKPAQAGFFIRISYLWPAAVLGVRRFHDFAYTLISSDNE